MKSYIAHVVTAIHDLVVAPEAVKGRSTTRKIITMALVGAMHLFAFLAILKFLEGYW
ncbi:MAG TPA: hypothetical protein VF145_10490 [Chitinophagaceae bacterium]